MGYNSLVSSDTAPTFVAQPLTPDSDPPTSSHAFSSADGTRLYGEWYEADGNRAALVIHGYSEHCGRYWEVAQVLKRQGIAVLAMDLRGHGRAEGQRGYAANYEEYIADLVAGLAQLHTLKPSCRVLLVAHSNGALVALRALCDPRVSLPVDAFVLSSPFLALRLRVPPIKRGIALTLGRFVPRLSLKSELDASQLTHDPDRQRERELDPLCHEVASAGWFLAARAAQAYVREMAHHVRQPSLWVVAGADPIADPAVTRSVQAKMRAHSRLIVYDEMLHEVFHEVGRSRVFADICEFLAEQFPK